MLPIETLPIDLVFVRHGQAEINAAKRRSESGNHSDFTSEFRNRHSSSFRLTDLGREQSKLSGEWIKSNLLKRIGGFDYCMSSAYLRAMETAGCMDIPGAMWYPDYCLVERDWGAIEVCPENEIRWKFGTAMRALEAEPFFTKMPQGESFAQTCLRAEMVLLRLCRDWCGKRVLVVCHGDVMLAFRFLLERIPVTNIKGIILSHDKINSIYNGQIIHYTRRLCGSGPINEDAMWVQSIRPTEKPVSLTNWRKIGPEHHYTNSELLEVVSLQPRIGFFD